VLVSSCVAVKEVPEASEVALLETRTLSTSIPETGVPPPSPMSPLIATATKALTAVPTPTQTSVPYRALSLDEIKDFVRIIASVLICSPWPYYDGVGRTF